MLRALIYKIDFRSFKTGNIQSWLKGASRWQKLIQHSEVCTGEGPKDVLLPWCLKFAEAKLLCEKYKGQMTIITSSELQRTLFLQLEHISEGLECTWHNEVWTGFSDGEVEGHFVDVNEGRALDAMYDLNPFVLGQPNGGITENCAAAIAEMPNENSWFDGRCDDSILSFCKFDKNSHLQIRGE